MILLPERQTLSDWLRIAAWRLADSARERIRVEIEAHYAQSVEAHRENGMSETAAHAAALAELGDPEAAAKRFRKQHLTEREEKRLKSADEQGRSIWFLLLNYSLFWLFTSSYVLPKVFTHLKCPWYYFALQSVSFIIIPTTCFVVARCSKVRPNGHVLWMQAFGDLGPSWFFYLVFSSMHPASAFNIVWCALVFLPRLPRLLISLHTCMKVGRLGTIFTHTPPTTKAGAS